METKNPIRPELIAPCGINCALCSRYLAGLNNHKTTSCPGCRPRNMRCTYLFAKCRGLNHEVLPGAAEFCIKCDQYPCKEIERLQKRYTSHYNIDPKANLTAIKQAGIDRFIVEEYRQHRCEHCGGLISMHNRKCFNCDTVIKLVEKAGRRHDA